MGGIATINPIRYRGYYFDTETGLYYLQTRFYDPATGRFISPDTPDYLDPESINGLNIYAYGLNNPVMYVDPTGHLAGWAIALILAGAVLAMTASTLAYGASTKETIVIDVSLSISLGGPNWKLGISVVIDFENEWIEFYPHTGGSIGLSSGLSFSFGKIENYEKQGDYEGVFIFGGGGYYGGLDHCFGPFDPYQEAVKATSVTIGGGGSVYFGVDYYIYVPEWTIYW